MSTEYSKEELMALMAQVEKEFAPILAKAEESFKLAKSEDEAESHKSKEKDEQKASDESKGESEKPMEHEKPEDEGVKDQHQQDTSKEDKGQPLESKEGRVEADNKENSKPSDDPHGDAQDHGYDDEDMSHMHSMYSSMSKSELKAHHDCIRKCMDGMGLAKCEDGLAKAETEDGKESDGHRPNGGPKDGEAASTKTAPASDATALEKSSNIPNPPKASDKQALEKSKNIPNPPKSSDAQALEKSEPSVEVDLLKSELEAAKASEAATKKNLEAVEAFLKKFVEKTAPAGKAITSLDIIAKTEGGKEEKPLSKSEIDARLLAKSKTNISKADREAINSYCISKNIEKVRHLL